MSRPIIEVRNLSKKYRLGAIGATSIREHASRVRDRIRGVPHPDPQEYWALRDVSFDIHPGEVVGVIGRNGAGKSTLLKILSRITEPTSGTARIRGRVASLLEVGTGFHPELTGRENVYLNGAILGMTRAEVKSKFDEIVAFAEIDQFIDTPVKRYSSGMHVRLAFAVAAHLEPEILIVDEVLAVGDAQFQKKCLGKIGEVSRGKGRTILFVSHNMGVVGSLCARALLLEHGHLTKAATAAETLSYYASVGTNLTGEARWPTSALHAKSERFQLVTARVLQNNRTTGEVLIDAPVYIEYVFEIKTPSIKGSSSIHLFDRQGVWVLCSGPAPEVLISGRHRHRVTIPANFLNDGLYTASIVLLSGTTQVEVHVRDAISFNVNETGAGRENYGGVMSGCIRPRLNWATTAL